MSAGLHIVTKRKPGRPLRHYVYAWRGGPLIHKAEGPRPKITAAISDAAAEARKARGLARTAGDTMAALILAFKASGEFGRLAATTRTSHNTWLERIREEFGDAPIALFDDRRVRNDIVNWRDRWAEKPRSADAGMQTMSRLLSWGFDRGKLTKNVATGIAQLYEADRSDVIWETDDFERFAKHASVEIGEGVALAAFTGLRRGDLVKLPWSAIGEHAIVWKTAKSRGRNLATIPLMPEAKALLARIRQRHADEMAIGETGFEPATSCSQSRRATGLRHSPIRGDRSAKPIVERPNPAGARERRRRRGFAATGDWGQGGKGGAGAVARWWARQDLNPQPIRYERTALTS